MVSTIGKLSKAELDIYQYVISLKGSIDEISNRLEIEGIFNQYKSIQKSYYELLTNENDDTIKLEALKRLTFLTWYFVVEPKWLTGIGDLDGDINFKTFEALNNVIKQNQIDSELNWMLSYYSAWDYVIFLFIENELPDLKTFIENTDTSKLHIPKGIISKEAMFDRGQMGVYFQEML